jgi:hypothetical protein
VIILPIFCCFLASRYNEMIYNKFGLAICHDVRLHQATIQKKVLQQYVDLFAAAIKDSFPLQPDPHQFLVRFMIARGWEKHVIVEFLFIEFTLPQLLRHVKATAFPLHFLQLRGLAADLQLLARDFVGLLDCVEKRRSFVEIPQAFTCFGVPFMRLLLTTADVNSMIMSLQQVNEVPRELISFVETQYLAKIDLQPLWIRVYLRKPKPVETSYNWRNVVFTTQMLDVPSNRDFVRMWKHLLEMSGRIGRDPIDLLTGRNLRYVDMAAWKTVNESLGRNYEESLKYANMQNMHDLQVRSQGFERHLVDLMSLNSLMSWQEVIDGYYSRLVIPTAIAATEALRKEPNCVLDLNRSIMRHIGLVNVQQLVFMAAIRRLLPDLPHECVGQFSSLDTLWETHILGVRETIRAPDVGSGRARAIFNQKLWEGVHHLNCFTLVAFEWALEVVLDSLGWLGGLSRSEEVIQYAIAISQCPSFLSRFICVNVFVVKSRPFRAAAKAPKEMLLWSRFEGAILKLLEGDARLMDAYFALQVDVERHRPIFGAIKVGRYDAAST